MSDRVGVYLEIGGKKTFASAPDWPGWSRGGKDADGALEALLAAASRYARVVGQVTDFAAPEDASVFDVVERLKGGGATDFGVPSQPARSDDDAVGGAELERLAAILRACWSAFDRAAGEADGVELRKGPRGGGRDLAKITEHMVGADESYLRQLGARPATRGGDESAADGWPVLREAIVQTLRLRARGDEPENPTKVKTRWSPRYFVRRAAWHVLDHAWEVEDRAK